MKRILSLLLALTLVFAFVACSNEKDTTSEPDTSTTQTETESTDTNDTQTSETDKDESSSDTETPSNSTSTPTTSTSKPTTSNKDNTPSSKPSNTTNTPTTSKPSAPSTPSTPSENKPEDVEYYDETRVVDRKITKEILTDNINKFMNNKETAKLKDFASSFATFDVFGYAFTEDEILNKSYLPGYTIMHQNNKTDIKRPTDYRIELRFKNADETFRAIKRDVKKFYEYVGNSQYIHLKYNTDPNDNIGNLTSVNTIDEVPDGSIRDVASGKYLNNAYIKCETSGFYNSVLSISCYEDGKGGILYWLDFRF